MFASMGLCALANMCFILNGMKYMQIGSVFLDDIAVLLFGVGFIIWFASWFAN